MATIYPIGPRYQVTSADNGKFLVLGDTSEHEGGFWRIHFAADSTWVGGIGIEGRASGRDAYNDGVAFAPVAYRRVQLAGAASDRALVQTGAPAVPLVNTGFIIEVPANGLAIALVVDWTQGYGYVYSMSLRGASL